MRERGGRASRSCVFTRNIACMWERRGNPNEGIQTQRNISPFVRILLHVAEAYERPSVECSRF
jgi:hypothetical protein